MSTKLYIGHFIFEETLSEHQRSGVFTLIAEAANGDKALQKFKSLITEIREKGEIFDRQIEMHLSEIIEINTIPPQGLFGHGIKIDGNAICWPTEGMVSTSSLDCAPEGAAECIQWVEHPYNESGVEAKEVLPFVEFAKNKAIVILFIAPTYFLRSPDRPLSTFRKVRSQHAI